MSGGEDWLMRPVLRGVLQFESLLNGTVNLLDIALLNEGLDVMDENMDRAAAKLKEK